MVLKRHVMKHQKSDMQNLIDLELEIYIASASLLLSSNKLYSFFSI